MNRKQTLMHTFKNQFGGEEVRENGKWFWTNGTEKNLVSYAWLSMKLKTETPTAVPVIKTEPTPAVPTVKEHHKNEVSEHKNETLVKDVGNKAPSEEQKSETKVQELTKNELRRLKRKERREKKLENEEHHENEPE